MMENGRLKRRHRMKKGRRSVIMVDCSKKDSATAALLKEYVHNSTIHGIQHIFREGETLCHSIIWTIFWILCVSSAVYLAVNSWKSTVNHPIAITINDTQYPLKRVWFPAVALCPSNKIILQKANEYISSHIKDQTILNDSSLTDFYKSLALLQHPLYLQMDNFLKNCEYLLPQLASINITALMYYMRIHNRIFDLTALVEILTNRWNTDFATSTEISSRKLESLPKCEDLFTFCYWQGQATSCCHELFSLQRSEEGFCYSFNSLTAEGINSSCRYFDAHNEIHKGCQLEKLISYGPATGLQIYYKILNTKNYTSLDFTGGPKLKVQVFHPNDFPQPGIFNSVPLNGNNKLNVEIQPTVTMSRESIKRFRVEERGCIFKEEVRTSTVTSSISQASCLLECRMAYMLRKCFCLPYYFNQLRNETAPVCNSLQLQCLVNASSDLSFYYSPADVGNDHPGDTLLPFSCEHCNPTCNEVSYLVNIESTKDLDYTNGRIRNFDGYIDIYYRTPGAVLYTRDVTYDFVQILANIGGIGGLFLGGSILSITEIIYWFSKAGLTFFWPSNKLEHKKSTVQQIFIQRH